MENFKESGVTTKQAHVKIPEGLFEEEHGRKGFFGKVSHLYHTSPPVNWLKVEGPLRPHFIPSCYSYFSNSKIHQENHEKNPHEVLLLFNQDIRLSILEFSKETAPTYFFRNADYDELYFIHQGKGLLETIYGPLNYTTGDYVVLPKGTTYKFYPEQNQDNEKDKEKTQILKIESITEWEQPSRGLLGPNALYDQTALRVPKAQEGTEKAKEYWVHVKQQGEITKILYPFNPLSAVGWKGSLYPFIFSIYDFCPIMSHRYHIPPSGHTTFLAQNVVICSFVERPLEESRHEVLKVPFYHSNIDFDEVLFYHKGNFFSRDKVGAGSLSFHPAGIHHGPHPSAFAKQQEKTYTDEYAVMIDTKRPLQKTAIFSLLEDPNYINSWRPK